MSQVPVLQESVCHEQSTGVLPMQVPLAQKPLEKHMVFVGTHMTPSLPGMLWQDWLASSHVPTLQASTPGQVLGVPLHTPFVQMSLSVQ
jgi:hypothetical protein